MFHSLIFAAGLKLETTLPEPLVALFVRPMQYNCIGASELKMRDVSVGQSGSLYYTLVMSACVACNQS
jgi:hypothetical protein